MIGLVYMALGAGLGIAVAFFAVWCYRRGITDGMSIAKKEDPKPLIEKKEDPAETPESELMKQVGKLMSYNPYEGER